MKMLTFISGLIAKIGTVLKRLHVKQILPMILVGMVLLATEIVPDIASDKAIERLEQKVQQENPDRPKTTAEWQQQANEVKGKPGERLKRIGEQSADAVKEFGSMYPDVAKNSGKELDNEVKANN
jgi:hypothetical protein